MLQLSPTLSLVSLSITQLCAAIYQLTPTTNNLQPKLGHREINVIVLTTFRSSLPQFHCQCIKHRSSGNNCVHRNWRRTIPASRFAGARRSWRHRRGHHFGKRISSWWWLLGHHGRRRWWFAIGRHNSAQTPTVQALLKWYVSLSLSL